MEAMDFSGISGVAGGKDRIFAVLFVDEYGCQRNIVLDGHGISTHFFAGACLCDFFLWMSGEKTKVYQSYHGLFFLCYLA